MSSRSLKVAAIVACFVVAGAPPLGFTHYLEDHAVRTARDDLQDYAERVISHVSGTLDEAVRTLDDLAATDVIRCGPGVRDEMREALFATHLLRETTVLSAGGEALCDSAILSDDRWQLTEPANPDRPLEVKVAVSRADFRRSVAVIRALDGGGALMALLAPGSLGLDILPDVWRHDGRMEIRLADGSHVQSVPQLDHLPPEMGDDAIRVEVAAARYPVEVEIAVARAAVMAPYAVLKAYTLVIMAVFAGIMMVVALSIASRRPSASDDIAHALKRGEFIPFYQPVINLSTGQLEGCEVLMRRRQRDGLIDVPANFIAQAEADGQIIPMTRELMRQAIEDIGDVYRTNRRLTLAFNLCARHFRDDGVVRDVQEIFAASPIAMSQLIFEVTERFPLADMTKAKSIIGKLQALGARIALDDAGTGHSGLAALHHLGMDIVKIDKIFIDPIGEKTTSAPIVDTLVDLAKSLDMSIVAEGVETLAQVRYLKARGVGTAQGYLFAPPLPASSYRALAEAIGGGRSKGEAATAVA